MVDGSPVAGEPRPVFDLDTNNALLAQQAEQTRAGVARLAGVHPNSGWPKIFAAQEGKLAERPPAKPTGVNRGALGGPAITLGNRGPTFR